MSAEEHGFKAEVQQLLDLMIHAVYSNRDVFLRELISNAADALDKGRFLALTETDLVPTASDELGIRISADEEAGTVTLEDDGVGMTRDEAIENLGTIAHSGSKAFLKQLKESGKDAPQLIGQFGVGFYSAFMVAEEVTVESRSATPGSEPIRWVSQGSGSYTIEAGERSFRGTRITLKLREDAKDYAKDGTLRRIIEAHSNYVPWPIHLGEDQANAGTAAWQKSPQDLTDEEANAFYKTVAMDWEDPLLRVHVKADTPFQYASLLFVPKRRPFDLFVPEASRGPRLYAKRVLIAEHAKELLPDWLRFLRGVVDSEDINLNMSREMVQQTPLLRKMKDVLTKRVLKDLGKLAKQDAPQEGDHPYHTFWGAFGILIKEGYYHDKAAYGDKLLPLLRFNSTDHDDASGLWSLDDYKAAMPDGQDAIWYLTAPTREAALASPHLEAFKKRGWPVLLLTDPVDEWFVQSLEEVDGTPVKSVSRGELELEEDEGADKADVTELAPWLSTVFEGLVAGVRSSNRLTDSPAVLVDDTDGVTANMERILRQANQEVPSARRFLEINPTHPLIRDLAELQRSGRTQAAEPIARLLLDDAMLLDGSVQDAPAVGKRLQDLLVASARQAVSAGGAASEPAGA